MNIRVTPLETWDQADALSRFVYELRGLTHHRSWLYDPETVLEHNKNGRVRSFLAVVADRVVGHLAAIQPRFEDRASRAAAGNRIIGLDLVHPEFEQASVRAQLSSAVYGWCMQHGSTGLLMVSPCEGVASQRLGRALGGVPTSLLLGSVPSRRGGPLAGSALSTLTVYMSLQDSPEARVYLPRPDRDLYEAIYDSLAEDRRLLEAEDGPRIGPASEVKVHFDPAREVGRIQVLRAGPDLTERVLERFQWLLGGRIRHVTVEAPLSSPFTARAVRTWKGHGMVFGGVVPGHERGDVAVFQGLRDQDLDPSAVRVVDPLAGKLRQRVLDDWMAARDLMRAPTHLKRAG
jgi:hypothetical protein